MLRLSKLTDYAVVVLVRLSEEGSIQTSGGIATATGVPEPTVAKVLKIMTAAGLVLSHRGAARAALIGYPHRRCDRGGGRPDRLDRLRRAFGDQL
jgi:alkylated DNA nucleotide flippase Atl1